MYQPMYNTIGKKVYLFMCLLYALGFVMVSGKNLHLNVLPWLAFIVTAALVLYGISKVKGIFGSILIGLINFSLMAILLTFSYVFSGGKDVDLMVGVEVSGVFLNILTST